MEKHKKLYEEVLVKEIMMATALCVRELIREDVHMKEDELYQFIDQNYASIIDQTLSGDDADDDE